jgi:hypothetical protein
MIISIDFKNTSLGKRLHINDIPFNAMILNAIDIGIKKPEGVFMVLKNSKVFISNEFKPQDGMFCFLTPKMSKSITNQLAESGILSSKDIPDSDMKYMMDFCSDLIVKEPKNLIQEVFMLFIITFFSEAS